MSEAEDRELVEKCCDGDRAAFTELVDRYQKTVFNTALRIVGDPEEAEDVAQSAFLKAYEKLDSYKPQYRFFSWIYRITVNESLISGGWKKERPSPKHRQWRWTRKRGFRTRSWA